MALTLEQLQEKRAKIVDEMGGVQRAEFSDRAVTHRPQSELEAALAVVNSEIAKLQPSENRVFTVQSRKGFTV